MGKKILALFSCIFAFTFLLSGCSSKDESGSAPEKGTQTETSEPSKKAENTKPAEKSETSKPSEPAETAKPGEQMVGVYALESAVEGGKKIDAKTLGEKADQFKLEIKADGTGNVKSSGKSVQFTWKALSDTELEMTADGNTSRGEFKDGTLTFVEDDLQLTFKKK
ncbi:hypothetical protein [Trueperella sp. LYQ143]|uniref:hypothetical protein n=1 Tax=Trueperella sp. LYQ143 TaxID=3391059 RepID=UPI0039834578